MAKRARESLDLWGVALRIMKPGSCGYASMQYRRVPQDLCENQKSFAGWLLLVKTAVIRLFFWLWIPRMKNWWAVLGIFHAKMPGFSCKSYQKIIGQISILVNGFPEKGDIAAILLNMLMLSFDFGKYNKSNHIRKCGKIMRENSC